MARVLVGTSGYQYRHWRGVLYPDDLATARWLPRYAEAFGAVELNATFYRLASDTAAARWRASTPRDFVFAAKGSRYLTHMKKLLDPEPGLERFFAPLRPLRRKLEVVLWQLPPRMHADALPRLDAFLRLLPTTVRHAIEFREPSWYLPEVADVLDAHGAAFCEHDLVPMPIPRPTGGFRYLRFHGATGRYDGSYGAARLAPFARDLAAWAARGHDAYVFFNNDLGGHAVRDAWGLGALLAEGRPSLPGDAVHHASTDALPDGQIW